MFPILLVARFSAQVNIPKSVLLIDWKNVKVRVCLVYSNYKICIVITCQTSA